jgi:predicted small lipoprotein YifL
MNLFKSSHLSEGAQAGSCRHLASRIAPRLLLLCATAGLLSACGQRGPLYLPPPPTAAKPVPQQLPAKSDNGVQNTPDSVDDIKPQRPAR